MRRLTLKLLGTLLCAACLPAAAADQFPTKPIRLVVGFAPGGPTDILARITAEAMAKALKQSVVVENRGGAGGLLAAQQLAKSPADGYTLMFAGDGQLTLLPQMFAKAGYDTERDFKPLRTVAAQNNVLMVNKALGVNDLASLIAKAKAAPGTISYGSAGNGTPTHLIGALFEDATQTKLMHVAYKGAGPAMTDLIGGQINLMFVGSPVAVQQASRPELTMLAATGSKRMPSMPNLPTFAELGVKGLDDNVAAWWAVVAPAHLPANVEKVLSDALAQAAQSKELATALEAQGAEVRNRDAAQTMAQIKTDQARWAALIKANRIATE